MPTDITLDNKDGNWLTLTAPVVQAVAADFVLEHPERRQNAGGLRRALVHDQNDGLTINFNGDYPGGVTINSVTRLSPHREQKPIRRDAAKAAARTTPTLHVDGGIRFMWDNGGMITQPAAVEVDLQSKLQELQDQISELMAKVAALGN